MPLLINENQQLDESEIMDLLVNKPPRTHKAMLISQGFNPKTGDLANLLKHCKQAGTTDNIATAKLPA